MERIGEEVERELSRSGSRDVVPLAAVTAAWPTAVGETVSRNAWPLRLARDGTLLVATASATWAQELTLLQHDVLERLRQRLGAAAPANLRFEVGPVPAAPTAAELSTAAPEATPETSPEVEAEAAAAAAGIEDEELRELVARAARASLMKARSGRSFW
jgi:predicted nucleic acid-binding Zn ribbon protein